mgnify:CR=1 FL=1
MSDQSNKENRGELKGGGGSSDLVPRRRVHKINDLLEQLPDTQKASLMSRLQGAAPQLINPQAASGQGKPIDTPMRRARAIARQLARGELPRDSQPLTDPVEVQRESPPPPMMALRSLKGRALLKVYQASPIEDWLSALKIAEIEIKEHLLVYLPPREKSALEDALRQLGPIKLSEAQEASLRVMSKAQHLVDRGVLKRLEIF